MRICKKGRRRDKVMMPEYIIYKLLIVISIMCLIYILLRKRLLLYYRQEFTMQLRLHKPGHPLKNGHISVTTSFRIPQNVFLQYT